VIVFDDPLPKSFTLALRGYAFGPNAGTPIVVRVGDTVRTLTLSGTMEERRVTVQLHSDAERKLEIIPPHPVSPSELGMSDDRRKLGVALERVWLERQ